MKQMTQKVRKKRVEIRQCIISYLEMMLLSRKYSIKSNQLNFKEERQIQ